MDLDVKAGIAEVRQNVAGLVESLTDPLNDLSDLAGICRSLRLAAECLETYVGIQHARNVREIEFFAGSARTDMRNNHH